MKKTLCISLAFVLCLLLCACSRQDPVSAPLPLHSPAAQSTANPEKTTASPHTPIPAPETENTAVSTPEATPLPEVDSTPTPEKTDGIRPEFKEAMDAYEAFYDEYCDFMAEYNSDPTNVNLLLQYGELVVKAQAFDEAFAQWNEDEMNNAELQYYLEVSSRVAQKLIDAMG